MTLRTFLASLVSLICAPFVRRKKRDTLAGVKCVDGWYAIPKPYVIPKGWTLDEYDRKWSKALQEYHDRSDA